jgi:HEAT repeat protein
MIGEGILVTAATVPFALAAVTLVVWLVHAAWFTLRERRAAALRPGALQALAIAIRDGDSRPAIAALEPLDRDGRVGAVVDMAYTVAGDQRERLNALVRETEIWTRAIGWAVSRLWSRRLHAARLFALFGSGAETSGDSLLDDSRPDVRAQASEWAGEHPTPARTERLVLMLADPDPRCRFAAREALISSGRAAVPAIRERLDAKDRDALPDLLAVAAALAVPEFLEPGLELCGSPDPDIRAGAAKLAGAIGGPDAVGTLSGQLNDPAPRVRIAAVRGLGMLGHWQAAGRVAELLEDEGWTVRRAAAVALDRMGPTGGLLLNRAARKGDPATADTARYALGLAPSLTGEG